MVWLEIYFVFHLGCETNMHFLVVNSYYMDY